VFSDLALAVDSRDCHNYLGSLRKREQEMFYKLNGTGRGGGGGRGRIDTVEAILFYFYIYLLIFIDSC